MKKLLLALMAVLCSVMLMAPAALAYRYDGNDPSVRVLDYAGLLTDDEEASLRSSADAFVARYSMDIVVLTVPDTEGKSVTAYADDFYDYGGYGVGPGYDGLLLMLSMAERDWYISTCGYAITVFTDYGIELIGDDIVPYLSDGDYYAAFDRFISLAGSYNDHVASTGEPYDVGDPGAVSAAAYYGTKVLIAFAVGAVIAAITVLVMRSKMKTARIATTAGEYVKQGTFVVNVSNDAFLYTHTTKIPRASSSSGGGSSTHSSSSGRSHGGGGGKF